MTTITIPATPIVFIGRNGAPKFVHFTQLPVNVRNHVIAKYNKQTMQYDYMIGDQSSTTHMTSASAIRKYQEIVKLLGTDNFDIHQMKTRSVQTFNKWNMTMLFVTGPDDVMRMHHVYSLNQ
jgi:hypothetical protein